GDAAAARGCVLRDGVLAERELSLPGDDAAAQGGAVVRDRAVCDRRVAVGPAVETAAGLRPVARERAVADGERFLVFDATARAAGQVVRKRAAVDDHRTGVADGPAGAAGLVSGQHTVPNFRRRASQIGES